jgi:hypothetical protein
VDRDQVSLYEFWLVAFRKSERKNLFSGDIASAGAKSGWCDSSVIAGSS